jgi:hypothetical protein
MMQRRAQQRMASPAAAIFCLVTAALGCGRPTVGATASGLVTINGKPGPPGLRVDFQPHGWSGSPSMGMTDAKGRYDLMFTSSVRGVMAGEFVIRVSLFLARGPDGIPKAADTLAGLHIPDSYGRNSTLVRTVKPGHNTIDIEIDIVAASEPP